MSEPTTTAPVTPAAAPETPAKPTEIVTPPAQEETDWKAEARKWESRAKENSKAAETLAALEEAKKTNEQKLQDRVDTAERALVDKTLEADRALVALDKGLTAAQAKRLVGTTREELAADADELLADLGTSSTLSITPRTDPSQGPKPTGASSPAQQFAEFMNKQLRG